MSFRGTTLRFVLSRPAVVTLTVRAAGRPKILGVIRVRGRTGTNRVRFTGVLHRRALRPGAYVITARATAGTRRSKAVSVRVVVLRAATAPAGR